MKIAYSYQRFSSIKQKDGDSTRRQNNAANEFCRQHGLTLVDTFRDEGVSGFKGKNFSNESALSAFLKLVESGKIKRGAVLIVENMDRLSRQSILPCLSKFTEIISKGISLGVISQNRILDEQSITANPMELVIVLTEFARANNESETKSIRSKSIVSAKMERIKKGERVFIAQKPTWIVGLEKGKFVTNAVKVKLVQRIFKMYLAGESCTGIATQLNKEKVATLREFKDGIWTNSIVREILKNKNVIGWYRINTLEVDNYYPAIIAPKNFNAVQNRLERNVSNRGGSKSGAVRNLFKGLTFCAECGQVMVLKTDSYKTVKGGTTLYSRYICRGAKQGTGCKNKGNVNVESVESAISAFVLRKHPSELIPMESAKDNKQLEAYETELAKAELQIKRFTQALAEPDLADMQPLLDGLKEAKRNVDILTSNIKAEKRKHGELLELPEAAQRVRNLFNADFDLDTDVFNKIFAESDTVKRKAIRATMPSIFKRLDFTFNVMLDRKSKKANRPYTVTVIDCTLVNGDKKSISVV